MLYELRIQNLLLMERAELELGPGLNILTGETGAGKTLLANALDLLLGGRARSGIVREGAAEAYVEGVFSVPRDLEPAVAERIPDDAQELVLARRVWPDGRTRAYLCGRSATVSDLRELGSELLAFYGQHEHRKLMLASAQLEVLDAHCGAEQLDLRNLVAAAHQRARTLERRLGELQELAGARDRELDLARFELHEIESVGPGREEEGELLAERERLRNLEALRTAAAAGAEAIVPDGGAGVAELLAGAATPIVNMASVDSQLGAMAERMQALQFDAEELGRELRTYGLGLEAEPGRLEQVEERLACFARLERKHGGSVEDVLNHAERCRQRIGELEDVDVALQGASRELEQAQLERDRLAASLSANRTAAAPRLAAAVRARLGKLAMPDASFEVHVSRREGGCGPLGSDSVEFVIAANPGLAPGPLREVASGGELSRVMLALLSAAHGEAGETESPHSEPLLVFDEIDAGVGGHTARAVGEHLRALAAGRQILCITHLPQVAALAERHFAIVKQSGGRPVRTTVNALAGDQVVAELVRMLGAGTDDRAASQHARQLLRAA